MTHDNPTPLADSGELRAELIAMHPVTIATQGERRGLLGDETVEALVQLFTRYSTARTLAVIGEDEKPNPEMWKPDYARISQNLLRAEQRQLLGQEGGEELKWASTS